MPNFIQVTGRETGQKILINVDKIFTIAEDVNDRSASLIILSSEHHVAAKEHISEILKQL